MPSVRLCEDTLRQPTPEELADLRNTAREIVEAQIRLYGALFDKASAYSNLILAVGYASVFAVWSALRDHLRPGDVRAAGVLLLVSVGAFVSFEIYKVFLISLATRRRAKALDAPVEQLSKDTDEFIAKLQAMEVEHAHSDAKAGKFWPISWAVSVGAGSASLALLMWAGMMRPPLPTPAVEVSNTVAVSCDSSIDGNFERCPDWMVDRCDASTTVFSCMIPKSVVKCAANTVQLLDSPRRYLCSTHDGRSVEIALAK